MAETEERKIIDAVLAARRIALLGVSRDAKAYSRIVCREMREKGFEPLAVNPQGGDADGIPMARSLAELSPAPEAAIALTPPAAAAAVLKECAESGIGLVWLRMKAKGIEVPEGMRVVAGYCPLMFMPDAGFPHRLHRGILKLFSKYPR